MSYPDITQWTRFADLGYSQETLRRFQSHVQASESGCWDWVGNRNSLGYGLVIIKYARLRAHRVSLAMHLGAQVPETHHVHHKCFNPSCVNPAHLEAVTPREHILEKTPRAPSAICAAKTHCHNGHEFNQENTRYTKNRKRVCKICNSAWIRKRSRERGITKSDKVGRPPVTHCKRGHLLAGDNLYLIKKSGGSGYAKSCKACRNETQKAYWRRKVAAEFNE